MQVCSLLVEWYAVYIGKTNPAISESEDQKSGRSIFLGSAHYACACKSFVLKCFPELQTLHYFNFFYLMCNFKRRTTLRTNKCMHTAVHLHVSALQSQVVKGRQVFRHCIHPLYVPRGLKTLQKHGFPIPTYG